VWARPLSCTRPKERKYPAAQHTNTCACSGAENVLYRPEDPGALDVEDGVPPPRAAPALLRRVVLNQMSANFQHLVVTQCSPGLFYHLWSSWLRGWEQLTCRFSLINNQDRQIIGFPLSTLHIFTLKPRSAQSNKLRFAMCSICKIGKYLLLETAGSLAHVVASCRCVNRTSPFVLFWVVDKPKIHCEYLIHLYIYIYDVYMYKTCTSMMNLPQDVVRSNISWGVEGWKAFCVSILLNVVRPLLQILCMSTPLAEVTP